MITDYPEYAEINGKKYKIDTDYRTALWCFDVINDDTITDYERAMAIVYLLFDFIPKEDFLLFFEKAEKFLEYNGNEKQKKIQKNRKIDMDFNKDRKYIMASFLSDFKMDINKTPLHFWEFIDLIEGLKEDCILNRIRDIRNIDPTKIKDDETRKRIKEAQEFYSLGSPKKKITKEQQKNVNEILQKLGIERK